MRISGRVGSRAVPTEENLRRIDALSGTAKVVYDVRLACLATAVAAEALAPAASLRVIAVLLLAIPLSFLPLRAWNRVGHELLVRPLLVALDAGLAAVLILLTPSGPVLVFGGATILLAALLRGRLGGGGALALLVATHALSTVQDGSTPLEVLAHALLLAAIAWAGLHLRGLLLERAELRSALDRTRAAAARRSERDRLAREMHDSLAKTLHGVHLLSTALAQRLSREGNPAGGRAEEIAESTERARREARVLIADLRENSTVDWRGRLDDLVAGVAGRGVTVELSGVVNLPELPAGFDHELCRVLEELTDNAVRHGGARTVRVQFRQVDDMLHCTVSDDGSGLTGTLDLDSLRRGGHFGVLGVHERVHRLAGTVDFTPGRPTGLVVHLELPLHRTRTLEVTP